MNLQIQRSGERYFADMGWLKTRLSFSFADYYDPENVNWGALRVFNDDRIAAATGFPPHPHRDMEILTYVFSGQLEHRDSMGNHGVVTAGGVQFMSAGTGVRHSEFNASTSEPLHLAQMWVLPGKIGVKPSYGQIDFTEADRRDRWLDVASGRPSIAAPIALTQDAALRVSQLNGTSLQHDFEDGRKGFLFVAQGDVRANGNALGEGDAARIAGGGPLLLEGRGEIVLWDVPDM